MRIQLTRSSNGLKLLDIEIGGAELGAFAHSMEHEAEGGAEWEGLTDEEMQAMISLFERIGLECRNEYEHEQARAAEVDVSPEPQP